MSHTIAIVDDHTLIAEALEKMISEFRNYKVLYTVGNGKELMERFKDKKDIPTIVLLDINMPVMNGNETATWLSHHHPDVKIMTLSMEDKEESLLKMVRCGAKGYLLKNIPSADLEHALDTLNEKGYFYPDWVTQKVILSMAGKNSKPLLPEINERELEFLQYAPTELTYKEIADKMKCSPRTVDTYRDDLFEKSGAKSRVSLVIWALKHDILKL